MYIKIFLLPVLIFFPSAIVFSSTQDTIPPEYTWTSPKQFSILTTDTIRLSADAYDNENGSGIKKVVFYTRYWIPEGRYTQRKLIGEVTTFPYEFIWDCSNIPDQDYSKLNFYCDAVDNEGNVCSISEDTANELGPLVVLDRNPALNETYLQSQWTKNKIVIDGDLSEWAPKDSIVFTNNDNTIVVYSVWNKKNVFFGIRVDDSSIISHFFESTEEYDKMPLEDIIEIYLDADHDHFEIRGKPDKSFLIAAGGKMYKRIAYIDGMNYNSQTYCNVNGKVKINGTLNKDKDTDSCYFIELAILWEELGVNPGNISSMGLEVWNNDKDYVDGNYFYAGWTSKSATLNNPSEWGNVAFIGRKKLIRKSVLFVFTALLCVILFIIIRIRKLKEKTIAVEKEYIRIAKDYIEKNFSAETMSRDEIAQFVGLSPSYFGHLFKKETSMSLHEYLTTVRIEKAKILLSTTTKNISEISYEVGYGSQSYFGKKFKMMEKISPTEFRQKHQKHP